MSAIKRRRVLSYSARIDTEPSFLIPAPNVIVVGVGTKHETEILHTDAFEIVMQPKRPGAFWGRRHS